MKKILIIGCGSIGERHLRCFQKTGRAEVAGCDPAGELRGRIGKDYGCRMFSDPQEALASGTWDGAVICTPAHLHLQHATLFLLAKTPVLIEKPLAVSLAEAERFWEQFGPGQGEVHVAYVIRSAPGPMLAKQELDESGFGPLRHVTVQSGQHFPAFRPAYREIYYARHETGGGAIQDALTHSINLVEWIAGPVESLFCDAEHQVLEGVEVEDTVNLICRHRGGVMSSFALNQFQAPSSAVMEFHCPGGSVRYDSERAQVGRMALGENVWTCRDLPPQERDDVFVTQANRFLDSLEGKPAGLCSLEAALQTLRVNLAALESARTGRKVVL